jgi:hypothetical protein
MDPSISNLEEECQINYSDNCMLDGKIVKNYLYKICHLVQIH